MASQFKLGFLMSNELQTEQVLPDESAKSAFLQANLGRVVTLLLWRNASDGARETFWTSVTLTPARLALVRSRLVDFA